MQRLSLTAVHKSIFAVVLVGAAAFCPMLNAATVFDSSLNTSQLLSVTACDGEIASLILRNSIQTVIASMATADPAGATAWLENLAVSDERENSAASYVWLSQGSDTSSLRFAIENTPALIGDGGRRGKPFGAISYGGIASNPIPEPTAASLVVISAFALLRRFR